MSNIQPWPFVNRQALINQSRPRAIIWDDPKVHRARIERELKAAGVSYFALSSAEAKYLPSIIHHNEHVSAAVFGRCKTGLVMLVATDKRIIFLDKKPLFANEDEINFQAVNGISWGAVGFGATVNLHTRVVDYHIRTLSRKSAEIFAHYIENRCLENPDLM